MRWIHAGNPQIFAGRVGEWLKPADCKSAAPCGLRRFESSPVHHPAWRAERRLVGQSDEAVGTRSEKNRRQPGRALCAGDGVRAWVAQLVERVLGKDEVTGSIPVPGSTSRARDGRAPVFVGAGVTQR